MVASTVDRVPRHTSQDINRQIEMQIAESVRWHAAHPEEIDRRLHELDQEWDIERTLEANASTLAFTGVMLGATVDKRWLVLPALVTAFLFQHAVQGWCPPLPILRRFGFRTAHEIETERYALKALRGDFGPIGLSPRDHASRASHALQAARL
jgi:hypothetical protein